MSQTHATLRLERMLSHVTNHQQEFVHCGDNLVKIDIPSEVRHELKRGFASLLACVNSNLMWAEVHRLCAEGLAGDHPESFTQFDLSIGKERHVPVAYDRGCAIPATSDYMVGTISEGSVCKVPYRLGTTGVDILFTCPPLASGALLINDRVDSIQLPGHSELTSFGLTYSVRSGGSVNSVFEFNLGTDLIRLIKSGVFQYGLPHYDALLQSSLILCEDSLYLGPFSGRVIHALVHSNVLLYHFKKKRLQKIGRKNLTATTFTDVHRECFVYPFAGHRTEAMISGDYISESFSTFFSLLDILGCGFVFSQASRTNFMTSTNTHTIQEYFSVILWVMSSRTDLPRMADVSISVIWTRALNFVSSLVKLSQGLVCPLIADLWNQSGTRIMSSRSSANVTNVPQMIIKGPHPVRSQPLGVLYIPSGGGKTSFKRLHPDWVVDIDDLVLLEPITAEQASKFTQGDWNLRNAEIVRQLSQATILSTQLLMVWHPDNVPMAWRLSGRELILLPDPLSTTHVRLNTIGFKSLLSITAIPIVSYNFQTLESIIAGFRNNLRPL